MVKKKSISIFKKKKKPDRRVKVGYGDRKIKHRDCNSSHPRRWLSDHSSKNELESINIAEPQLTELSEWLASVWVTRSSEESVS